MAGLGLQRSIISVPRTEVNFIGDPEFHAFSGRY